MSIYFVYAISDRVLSMLLQFLPYVSLSFCNPSAPPKLILFLSHFLFFSINRRMRSVVKMLEKRGEARNENPTADVVNRFV